MAKSEASQLHRQQGGERSPLNPVELAQRALAQAALVNPMLENLQGEVEINDR